MSARQLFEQHAINTPKTTNETLKTAGARLVRMTVQQFAYEQIIKLEPDQANSQQFHLCLNQKHYTIAARPLAFGEFDVTKVTHEDNEIWQVSHFYQQLCAELTCAERVQQGKPQINAITAAYLIKEINHTWMSEAHLLDPDRVSSQALIDLPAEQIEGELRGHPWITFSKGRLGFSYQDYQKFAPEMRHEQPLGYVAVHSNLAQFNASTPVQATEFLQAELGSDFERFCQRLTEQNLSPEHYLFLPVHEWQWQHWIYPNFLTQIALNQLVWLGFGSDTYLPMQSIRTFCNLSDPKPNQATSLNTRVAKHHVKLPLSILNTAVYRGLPSARNRAAPLLSAWLKQTFDHDRDLKRTGLVMLGEVATITVDQPSFDPLIAPPYQFTELLGCLWRENPTNFLNHNEQVLSQSALLHQDTEGNFVISELIKRSGYTPQNWLKQFFSVCVTPLLYWLYRYGVVFSPHGENSLLIHEGGVPKRLVIKDFIDDVNLADEDFPQLSTLPDQVDRLLLKLPAQELSHFIFTGLFVVHYRFIAPILGQEFGMSEMSFWGELRAVIESFHDENPDLKDRIDQFDLLRPEFERVCLNQVRLFTRGYQDAPDRPEPIIAGMMINPVGDAFAPFAQSIAAPQVEQRT